MLLQNRSLLEQLSTVIFIERLSSRRTLIYIYSIIREDSKP